MTTLPLTLRVFNDFLGRAADDLGGENRQDDLLFIKWADVQFPFWNCLSLDGPRTTTSNLESALISTRDYMRGKRYTGYSWVFEESFSAEVWESLPRIAKGVGLEVAFPGTSMVYEGVNVDQDEYLFPEPTLQGVTFKRITTTSDLHHLADLNSRGYGMTLESGRSGFITPFYTTHNYAYLAVVAGIPVATASTAVSGDVLFVTYVATDPDHQGKGYAGAVVRKAIREGVRETGLKRVVLHATDAGKPVYQKIGFRKTGGIYFLKLAAA